MKSQVVPSDVLMLDSVHQESQAWVSAYRLTRRRTMVSYESLSPEASPRAFLTPGGERHVGSTESGWELRGIVREMGMVTVLTPSTPPDEGEFARRTQAQPGLAVGADRKGRRGNDREFSQILGLAGFDQGSAPQA